MFQNTLGAFTKTIVPVVLASACFINNASAVGPGYLGNLSGQTISIGNSFANGVVINDIYTFDIMPISSVAGTAITIELDIQQLPGEEFAIDNFMIAFLDKNDTLIVSDVPLGPSDLSLSIFANLPADTGYQFVVTGTATGTLGGSYGGALAAAAVPEAHTVSMMLAGLGLVGYVASRRQRRSV